MAYLENMVRFLDPDYEDSLQPSNMFVSHFWDTIDAIGGWKGLVVLSVGIVIFYIIVLYTVTTARQRQIAKKKK